MVATGVKMIPNTVLIRLVLPVWLCAVRSWHRPLPPPSLESLLTERRRYRGRVRHRYEHGYEHRPYRHKRRGRKLLASVPADRALQSGSHCAGIQKVRADRHHPGREPERENRCLTPGWSGHRDAAGQLRRSGGGDDRAVTRPGCNEPVHRESAAREPGMFTPF